MLSPESTHAATLLPTESIDLAAANSAALDDGWYSLLLTMGRWAVARADAGLVVQSAAALLAKALGADFSIVAELIDDQRQFQVCLTPPENNSAAITFQTPADDPQSLVGRVVTAGHALSIADLAADSKSHDPRLLAAGGHGLILCPLRSFNEPFGALGVLTTKPRQFRQRETMLVEVAAHFITTTIAQRRSEQALAGQRASSELLLATIDALAIVVTPAGRVAGINLAAERITGFSGAELFDRPIFSALLAVDEVTCFETALDALAQGGLPQKLEGWILTKSGERRRIAWTCAVQPLPGAKPTILCTGIDVTELAELRTSAASAQQQADENARQLEKIRRELAWMESTPWSDGGPPAFLQIGDNSRNERRTAERKPYPYVQLLAPMTGNQRPPQSAFEKNLCHDISSGGFSYFAKNAPQTKRVMAAFGVPGSLTYLSAEIVHCRHVPDKQMYLVGCRYLGRADYD
jgi:PAS domain S-box-containing protein